MKKFNQKFVETEISYSTFFSHKDSVSELIEESYVCVVQVRYTKLPKGDTENLVKESLKYSKEISVQIDRPQSCRVEIDKKKGIIRIYRNRNLLKELYICSEDGAYTVVDFPKFSKKFKKDFRIN